MKQCSMCKEIKPLTEFSKWKSGLMGVDAYCKKCKSYKNKKWRSESNYKPSQESKEKKRKWRKGRRNDENYTYRKRYAKNPAKALEAIHRYRAKKVGGHGTITEKEWHDLCKKYGNMCLCCKRIDVKLTIDHIVPLKNGGQNVIENAQPLCGKCNSSKKDKHIDYRIMDA